MAAEKTFENKIKQYLEDRECWFVKFFANAYTKVGIPDLLCCVNGFFVAIEVKAPNGKPSALQKYNVRMINDSGGYAVIVRPSQWEDFQSLIVELLAHRRATARSLVMKINDLWDV